MKSINTILAIDTSCDETSVAVTWRRRVLANVMASQVEIHRKYGGVFPTEAKRAHEEKIDHVVTEAVARVRRKIEDFDAIAVTYGPGLAPALEVGIRKAKVLTEKYMKPLIAVNHLEGHLLSCLTVNSRGRGNYELDEFKSGNFPVLGILVSGAHTELVKVNKIGTYEVLGRTLDDAAGEAFDKVGRMLGIGYPAGEFIEKLARSGDANRFDFPIPMARHSGLDFSFSGIKTAVLYEIENLLKLPRERVNSPFQVESGRLKEIQLGEASGLDRQTIQDVAASFQRAVIWSIILKLKRCLDKYEFKSVWLGGGVAANAALRREIRKVLEKHGLKLFIPYSERLYMDNAAMIGVAGWYKAQRGEYVNDVTELDRVPGLDF
jgi:N6-L-threonylcarbamoyladenine synthase